MYVVLNISVSCFKHCVPCLLFADLLLPGKDLLLYLVTTDPGLDTRRPTD